MKKKKSVIITAALISGAFIIGAAFIKGGFDFLKPSGTVTEVSVKAGDAVKVGDSLLVLR